MLEEVAGQGAVCVASEPQWIEWGPDSPGYPACPVSPGTDCEVRFLDESISRDKTPQMWTWHHIGYGDHDIIAYRMHPAKDDAPTFPMPLDIHRFLMGNGPLEGVWFGDDHPTRKGKFWWRTVIRERAERNP